MQYWKRHFNEQEVVNVFFEEHKKIQTKGRRQRQEKTNGSPKNNQ